MLPCFPPEDAALWRIFVAADEDSRAMGAFSGHVLVLIGVSFGLSWQQRTPRASKGTTGEYLRGNPQLSIQSLHQVDQSGLDVERSALLDRTTRCLKGRCKVPMESCMGLCYKDQSLLLAVKGGASWTRWHFHAALFERHRNPGDFLHFWAGPSCGLLAAIQVLEPPTQLQLERFWS